jgi:heme exporter protein D
VGALGPHAGFIVAAYAAVVAVVIGLPIWIALDYRRQRAELRMLETRGATRRSQRAAQTQP